METNRISRSHFALVCIGVFCALSATSICYADDAPVGRKNPCAKDSNQEFYPNSLKRLGVGGKVLIEVTLDDQGCVSEAKVVKAERKELEKGAIGYARTWHLSETPDSKDKPTRSKFLTIEFKMVRWGEKCNGTSTPIPPSEDIVLVCGSVSPPIADMRR